MHIDNCQHFEYHYLAIFAIDTNESVLLVFCDRLS